MLKPDGQEADFSQSPCPAVVVTHVARVDAGQRPDVQRSARHLGEGGLERSPGSWAWQCLPEAL